MLHLTKEKADKALKLLKENLNKQFPGKITLYVFGSVARGDFYPESDIDVLILFDGDLTREVEKKILDVSFHIELDKDVVYGLMIESKNEWQTPLFCAMPIHKKIDIEGVLV